MIHRIQRFFLKKQKSYMGFLMSIVMSSICMLQNAQHIYAAQADSKPEVPAQGAPASPVSKENAPQTAKKPPVDNTPKSGVVGVSLPLSGAFADYGASIRKGLESYVQDQDKVKTVSLRILDDAGDPKKAVENIRTLANDPAILALMGSWNEDAAIEIAKIAQEKQIVVLSPSAEDPSFSAKNQWAFSGTLSSVSLGQSLAQFVSVIEERKQVVVVHGGAKKFLMQKQSFVDKAKKLGVEVIEIPYTQELSKNIAQKIKPETDALILFIDTAAGTTLVKEIRDANIKLPLYGNEAFGRDVLKKYEAKKYRKELYTISSFTYDFATLETSEFIKKYNDSFNSAPSTMSAIAYDSLAILARAIQFGGAQRAKIKDFLRSMNTPFVAYVGLTGKLYFDQSNFMRRDAIMSKLHSGGFAPALQQLKRVVRKDILEDPAEWEKRGDVLKIDGELFHRVRVVLAGLDIYRIDDVDNKGNKLDLEYFLWFKWQKDRENAPDMIDPGDFIFASQDQVGKLSNSIVQANYDLKALEKGPRDRFIAYRVRNKFIYPYDMKKFPFDTQRIPLTLVHSNKDADQVMLVVDKAYINKRKVDEVYPREWQYIDRVDFSGGFNYGTTFGAAINKSQLDLTDYSAYRIDIILKRILLPYLLTFFFPLFIMMGINFLGFFGPAGDAKDKKNRAMTFLVGLVVFHVAMSKLLPQVGYLVRTDLFMFFAYAIVCIQIAMAYLMGYYNDTEQNARSAAVNTYGTLFLVGASVIGYALLFIIP